MSESLKRPFFYNRLEYIEMAQKANRRKIKSLNADHQEKKKRRIKRQDKEREFIQLTEENISTDKTRIESKANTMYRTYCETREMMTYNFESYLEKCAVSYD